MSQDDKSPIRIDWGALKQMFGGLKLGPGVMGRSTHLCALLVVFGAVVAFALKDSDWVIFPILLILFLIFYVVHRAFNFITENPNAALLESAELIRAMEMEQLANDTGVTVPDQKLVGNSEPPIALTNNGENDA